MRAGRSVLGVFLSILAACGGGDTAGPTPTPEPTPTYPSVAGTYNFPALFDQLTYADAHVIGVITLVQPSRNARTLTGDFDFVMTVDGQSHHWAVSFDSAWVSTGGTILFSASNGPETWTYTGTLTGTAVAGRHTLTGDGAPITGDWTGSRSATASAQMSRAAVPARPADLHDLIEALRR